MRINKGGYEGKRKEAYRIFGGGWGNGNNQEKSGRNMQTKYCEGIYEIL